MSDLPALLKRLESVTGRLEELASKGGVASGGKPAANGTSGSSAAFVEAFDEILSGPVKQYLELSAKVGGLVNDQAAVVQQALEAQKQYLVTASKSKKPDAAAVPQLLAPLSTLLTKVAEFKDKNKGHALSNHLSVVADGIPALGWVAVEPKPAPFIEEMKNAAQYFSNRILKEFKEKDKTHVDWANSFMAILTEVHGYVKKYHTTGVVWNPSGEVAKAAPAPAAAQSKPAAAPTPAPAAQGKPAAAALFGELNKGGDITSGLKKVEKSQMTHKNPELRASSVVKAKEEAPAPKPIASGKTVSKAPPKFALEGNRWCVENQDNQRELVITDIDPKNIVYIGNCTNCTIQVKGKANAVVFDGCKKTAVVVESLVSSFDVINCKSVQCQITGTAPTCAIDKTDGCILYLSKECLGIEIFTSKSSELNVSIPGKNPNDDYIELPVAEQFKTMVKDNALVTGVVEHKG